MSQTQTPTRHALHDLGYLGHYLHVHTGGRNGRQRTLMRLLDEGPITQRSLLDQSGVSSATLSETLAKLEAEGLLVKERSREDRRQLVLTLTDEGREAARRAWRERLDFEERAFSCLTAGELDALVRTLDRVRDQWQQEQEAKKGDDACKRS